MAILPDAQAVLSAMITPAVLISACASLIMATTGRLNRAVDRTRAVAAEFASLVEGAGLVGATESAPTAGMSRPPMGPDEHDRRRTLFFLLLDYSTTRSRMLQRGLTRLYWALGAFVATSVSIGLVAVSGREYTWIPIVFGIAGAALLLYASVVLVRESQIALAALETEMDHVWHEGKTLASPEMLALRQRIGPFGGRAKTAT